MQHIAKWNVESNYSLVIPAILIMDEMGTPGEGPSGLQEVGFAEDAGRVLTKWQWGLAPAGYPFFW